MNLIQNSISQASGKLNKGDTHWQVNSYFIIPFISKTSFNLGFNCGKSTSSSC